jgi:hypothetical protein
MMRKARLAIRKVNVEAEGPRYYLAPVAGWLALSADLKK